MSMELMAPPAGPSLLERIRRWLELPALVAGQRRDFDALAQVLEVRDAQVRAMAERLEAQDRLLGQAVGQLNRNSSGLAQLDDRLAHHEKTVPSLAGSRRAYDATVRREVKRRQALIAEHPELSEAGRQQVMHTGRLPMPAAAPDPSVPSSDPVPG